MIEKQERKIKELRVAISKASSLKIKNDLKKHLTDELHQLRLAKWWLNVGSQR